MCVCVLCAVVVVIVDHSGGRFFCLLFLYFTHKQHNKCSYKMFRFRLSLYCYTTTYSTPTHCTPRLSTDDVNQNGPFSVLRYSRPMHDAFDSTESNERPNENNNTRTSQKHVMPTINHSRVSVQNVSTNRFFASFFVFISGSWQSLFWLMIRH